MADRLRVVLVCPGRGSYTRASLGSLPADHPLVERAEALRATFGLEPLLDLDRAETFDPTRHLRAVNASPLIWLTSLLDAQVASGDHRLVGVVGNSLGWYTALTIGGGLSFDDGFQLVQHMALLQEAPLPDGGPGGQVIYPLADADWQSDPGARAAVASALMIDEAGGGRVLESIELGGYAVLAGDEAGVARLMRTLPALKLGERLYPLRLAGHGPYHTPLVAHVAQAARALLDDLGWRRPNVTLVDGRGARWTPWSTDPAALRDYTLGDQVVAPYRFATSVRVALRELAPDALVLPGPGNSLGGICGQLVASEGYRGISNRTELEAVQRSDRPVVLSMGR